MYPQSGCDQVRVDPVEQVQVGENEQARQGLRSQPPFMGRSLTSGPPRIRGACKPPLVPGCGSLGH